MSADQNQRLGDPNHRLLTGVRLQDTLPVGPEGGDPVAGKAQVPGVGGR